ncbi:arginyl-tRNA synthetase [Spiroplasma cantharicola]|uniref:Arginine--tRNA ligase n=2 Tax=Spiroplasma cantharicola TaxID=362837 RepID=A0A0M4KDB2_9MOLU|nr:arginine--tRNA ligase [Spiroplasma cantharicola]ALD66915.1 arginyl-tRNA synthetase [Spiroplasma cantharicola]
MNILIDKIRIVMEKAIKKLNLKGDILIERPKLIQNADFATNFALINSKLNTKNPIELAELIVNEIKNNEIFENVEFIKPGFINFRINNSLLNQVVEKIINEKDNFGKSKKKNKKYNLEIVSANPTGYLHVGHARNGAIGDSVARTLRFAGYDVETEYYVNDAGNQINVSAATLFYHYKKMQGLNVDKPEEMYGGEMYKEVATLFIEEYKDKFKDISIVNNKINNEEVNNLFKQKSIIFFMNEIKNQMSNLGVTIQHYSSEAKMYENDSINKIIKKYKELGATYEKDDALWLKTTEFGDDKDRVLKKTDGSFTYITPDIASHSNRIDRTKADKYINFWGGDHHGYITRLKAGLALLGYDFNLIDIDMIQMVRLMKDGQEFKMSKRKGTAVWLIDLLEMVGKDCIRYMLVSKTPSSHMDFDLDLALEKNSTNPVYYAQYATARSNKIISSFKKLKLEINNSILFESQKEKEIIILLDSFNSIVEYSASSRLPNIICDFIQTLAKSFHSYYAETKILDEQNINLTNQRVLLIKSIYQVLSNAFNLIGIDVKDDM